MMISPQILVLRAVFAFLVGEGYSPWWDGLDSFRLSDVPNCYGDGRFEFFLGDLAILGAGVDRYKTHKFTEVQYKFDIADPKLFDQILEVLK